MKAVELALKAGRKRQSEITRFVHLCHENPEKNSETIPVYDNFCFALALLRSKMADNVLEAKALLEKLLAFQVNGQFPVYLHEYPECRYTGLSSKLYPIIFYILRDFHTVIGEKLRTELQKIQSTLGEPKEPTSPEGWAEFLIHAQLTGQDKTPAFKHWDPICMAFIGPQKQERGEPAVTLYDLFLGEWGGKYSARALQDHPVHLRASLIYPGEAQFFSPTGSVAQYFWGDGHPTHSLVLETAGTVEGHIIQLPEKEVQDTVETAFYCNIHPDTELCVDGKKATTFQPGETVQIVSKGITFELSFKGEFWGHIYRGNRPGQISCRGEAKYEAYDWIIALRTVKRSLSSTIHIGYNVVYDTTTPERSTSVCCNGKAT
jgi:hypothetical protein